MRGKVLSIGVNHYKFQRSSDNKIENVLKREIKKVIFSGGRSERGYEKFFARLLTGMGPAEYGITLNESLPLKSSHPLLRLGVEGGWQVIDYHLALYGGLEYTHSNFYDSGENSYSYTNLNFGASYFLPIPSRWPRLLYNTYLGLQLRVTLGGSSSFYSDSLPEKINAPIEGEGVGFGIRLGKNFYTNDWKIWGLALHYTRDRFKSQEKENIGFAKVGPVSIPGTPSLPGADITGSQEELDTFGFTFSLSYD